VYDGERLLVGVVAYDREPDRVVARIRQRDRVMDRSGFGGQPSFAGDDAIALLFDPFHDHRNGVVLATNPNGAEFDALLTDEGREFNVDWRGVWEVAATRTAEGWSAEFEIPLRTLRYPVVRGESVWGLNVFRMIRRKNEEVLWRSWSRENEGFQRVSRAGHLRGLVDLPEPGINLEMKPYVLAGARQERGLTGDLPTDGDFDTGLDLKTEPIPGLVLDVTLNTDFAQVEVDDAQVNLTRFDLFFPEKRDFFLENAGIFEFGLPQNPFGPPPFLLFFSRRIGIGADGEVPILGGARLTGRAGGQTLGFMNVLTDETTSDPVTNFAVARVKRDVGGSAYVGLMATDRRSSEGWNTAVGVDGSFWLGPLNLQAFAARTASKGPGGDDEAFRVALDYTGDRFGGFAQFFEIGPDIEARSGFITRTDIRRSELFLRYTPRPDLPGVRKITIFSGGNYQTRTDNVFQDYSVGPNVTLEFESGDQISGSFNRGETRLDEGFTLADSVPIPAGRTSTDNWRVSFTSSPSRAVSASAAYARSDFFEGTLTSLSGTLSASPTPSLTASLTQQHDRVRVPGGGFTVDITRARLGYAFSTKLFANLLVQYNRFEGTLSTNLRVNFIHRPGSDLFLVFTEERGTERRLWDVADRGTVVKLTYLQRF
ncbi:MAG: hypothetical protein D6701_03375, partial [Gemmatimonadetes bacterium]